MERDEKAFSALFVPNAVFAAEGEKTQTLKEAQTNIFIFMRQLANDASSVTVVRKITFVSPSGSNPQTAVVRVTHTLTGTMGQQKKRVSGDEDHTWQKTGAGWRMIKQVELSLNVDTSPILPTITPAEQKAVLSELQTRLVPLSTVEAGHGFDDLAPIGAAVGNARIVALGEASHGTREFFQMKYRLLEYLVKEKGFTVFAIEANYPEVLAVDRYVKRGEGDGKTALAGTYFWTWYTQEVLDMIEWMRTYNKTRPAGSPALTFTGFDMQTAEVAAKQAQDFLDKANPNDAKIARALYAPVLKINDEQKENRSMTSTGEAYKNTVAPAEAVLALFDNNRDAYVKATSQSEYDVSRQCALVVAQAQKGRATSFMEGAKRRDVAMAENVRWLANTAHPKEKIVLWAHNGHVGTQTYGGGANLKSMGMYLRDFFGPDMAVIGFAFNKGEIRAKAMTGNKIDDGPAQPLPVSPAKPGTGDALFALAGQPRFFLDLRSIPTDGPLGKWLAAPQIFRMPGAMWDKDHPDNFAAPTKLAQTFDALIFVDESHASQSLGPRPLPAPKAK